MAKKKQVLKKGFAYTKAALETPLSPEGFEWPVNRGTAAASKETTKLFAQSLSELIAAKGMTIMTFAGELLGEELLPNGHLQRQGAAQVRRWLTAKSFPSEKSARAIAAFFQVPMARLLAPVGGAQTEIYQRVPKGKRKQQLNGNAAAAAMGGNGKHPPNIPEPPPPRPPKGAKPAVIKIETMPADASWANAVVSGTMPVDVALGLLAYMERHKAHS